MPIRDLEELDARLELDPQTQEWLESFEGPAVALLAEGVRSHSAPVTAFELKLDPWTADWLKSRRNSRTVLSFTPGSAQQPPRRGPSSSDAPPRPARRSALPESFDCTLSSNTNIESAWIQGSIA